MRAFALCQDVHPGRFKRQMRSCVVVMLVLFCFGQVRANQSNSPAHFRAPGEEYVRLQSWAEANGLRFLWTKKEEELQLTNRTTRIALKVNSQRAEINGIMVFLLFPVIVQQGAPLIAAKDVSCSLGAIIFPAYSKTNKVQVIALGAGHGGKDSGYRVGEHQEKTYTLLLAKEIQRLLSEAGLKAVLIRNADLYVPLEERPVIARREKADLYLELHYNSAGGGSSSARGVEVYSLTASGAHSTNHRGSERSSQPEAGNANDRQNVLLAYQVQKRLVQDLGAVDRGVRRARFAVLRDAEMPAALIEAGFMSEPGELGRITDRHHREKTARAVVNALLDYKKLMEK
jgi:N-acetylmuramoyl-L-alanine amidase